MFLSSQAVSVLKQQQETTYIALPTLANFSLVTGFWPGLDWFPSQCLEQASVSMTKTLRWTSLLSLLTSKQPVMLLRRQTQLLFTPQADQHFTQKWGARRTQQPKVASLPFLLHEQRKEFLCVTPLLFSSIKWRERKGEGALLQRPAAPACSSKSG